MKSFTKQEIDLREAEVESILQRIDAFEAKNPLYFRDTDTDDNRFYSTPMAIKMVYGETWFGRSEEAPLDE